jgi:segregation and condensation protein A
MVEQDPRAALEAAAAGEDAGVRLDLPVFQGPLDLLLHLIERNELDITEVSLLAVTEQYMAQLRRAERINLASLADFIAVGARLILLKSRALLPRDDEGLAVDDGEGDARDLIDALKEYRRFKEAAGFLRERDGGHATYRREATPPKVTLPTGLDTVTLDALTDLLREVIARMPEEEPEGEVRRDPIRLRDRMRGLVDVLERDGQTSFRRLIESATSRTVVIVDFMAVLELIKSRYLAARQSEAFGDIDLVKYEGALAPNLDLLAAEAEGEDGEGDGDD